MVLIEEIVDEEELRQVRKGKAKVTETNVNESLSHDNYTHHDSSGKVQSRGDESGTSNYNRTHSQSVRFSGSSCSTAKREDCAKNAATSSSGSHDSCHMDLPNARVSSTKVNTLERFATDGSNQSNDVLKDLKIEKDDNKDDNDENDDDDDDDDLPPLENMSLKSKNEKELDKNPSSETINDFTAKSKKPQTIKRGFFDAKPTRKRSTHASNQNKMTTSTDDDIPMLSAKADANNSHTSGKSIPSFLRVDPTASDANIAIGKMKEKLVEEMKPTPEMMQSVQGNEKLMSGFDDPEVMAAVADVAKNPQNISKYQHNIKVMNFYKSMAGMMADKFNKKAEEQEQRKV